MLCLRDKYLMKTRLYLMKMFIVQKTPRYKLKDQYKLEQNVIGREITPSLSSPLERYEKRTLFS
jgi:hypothetical protein